MGLKQMLGGMSYIEQCRLSLRKAVNEKLGLKFGPLDVREFLYEGIDGDRAGNVVESVNVERGYEGLCEITIRAGDDRVETTSPDLHQL